MKMGVAMELNKVLIVKLSPYNASTSSNMRTMALIKGLQELGYICEWLTIAPSVVHTLANLDQYDFMNRVNYILVNGNATYDKIVADNVGIKAQLVSVLRKMYHMFMIYDHTESIAKKVMLSDLQNTAYKYVFSVSDPKTSHIVVRRLKEQGLKFERWVQYWGDPLVGDITGKQIYPNCVLTREERKLFSGCDRIVYTSPITMRNETRLHPQYKSKMIVVPTPFIEKKCYGMTNNDKPLVGYFGAYKSSVRNIMHLYQAAAKLKDTFDFLFVGDTDLRLEKTSNIDIKPRGDITNDEKRTDIYVCVLNSSGTQIPGKIYHNAATDKPVLVILDGEAGNEIKEYLSTFERYYFCENNAEDIVRTLNQIVRENKEWKPSNKLEPVSVVKKMLDFDKFI